MTQISRQSETETTPLLHKHADNTPSPTQHHQTNPKEGPVSPENRASLPSRLTLWWFNDFFRIGYRRQIQEEDLYQMLDYRRTEVLGQGLVDNWEAEKQSASVKGRRPSLLRALVWSFWRQYLPSFMWLILADFSQIANPFVIKMLLMFLQDSQTQNPPPQAIRGYGLAFTLLFLSFSLIICAQRWSITAVSTGIYMRTAFIDLVFRKATTLSTKSHLRYPDGSIINLMSTDISRIDSAMMPFSILFSAPIFILTIMGIMVYMMGPAALLGTVLLMLLSPIQAWGTSRLGPVRKKASQFTDSRIKLSSEILQGVKVIKFFTWENNFLSKLASIRGEELALVRLILRNRSLLTTTSSAVPIFASAFTFVLYAALGHELKPEIVFPVLAYYAVIRVALAIAPNCYTSAVDAYVAIKRLEEFLLSEDGPTDTLSSIDKSAEHALVMEDADFIWETLSETKDSEIQDAQENVPYLNKVNLKIPRGSLAAIVGPVGSGKSSLLQAMIGTMTQSSGQTVRGSAISYASQTPWIQNATIRDNILFDQPFDEKLYWRVVRVCCLIQDLDSFPARDLTEIGERGVNLSGGQKARLSLARSVYFTASSGSGEMVVMDDPLSAVDAHVGKRLWKDCMLKELKGQTRVIATHQLHVLPDVDYVICMKDGVIVEQGTFQELMRKDGGELKEMMTQYGGVSESALKDQEQQDEETSSNGSSDVVTNLDEQEQDDQGEKVKAPEGATLMTEEERESGAVGWKIYSQYFQMGGLRMWSAVVACYVIQQVCGLLMNYWLSLWTDKRFDLPVMTYIFVYVGLASMQFVVMAIATQLLSVVIIRTARKIHSEAFDKVIHAPLSFFDTNPLGRILNRFSKDVDALDNNLWMTLNDIIYTLLLVMGSVSMILIFFPYLSLFILPLVGFYYFLSGYYRSTSRELKRLDSTLRSNLYSYFTESLTGMATLKAYKRVERAIRINQERMDSSNRPYYLFTIATRWIASRLQLMGASLMFMTAVFVVGTRNTVDAATAGLVFSYLARTGGDMSWVVQCVAAFENNMNSAERLIHYIKNLPQEPPTATSPHRQPPLSPSWPSEGFLEFKNVTLRYRPDLPPVLRDISFSIQAGHRVGVVGRTGAGKSSLIQALFLLAELDAGSQIMLDGIDTQTIGTADLRSHIAIIPQDPVLFEGTFRYNLDPLERHTEQELWQVLETSDLKSYVQAQEGGLDAVVLAKGENLSVGQRQLVCLSRALLAKCKIVVLDEATASVDMATDVLIQRAIRSDFANATVMTIAHRINTIIDYDRILVMHDGRVAEYDTPQALLQDPNSIFSSLANESGVLSR
ncbi:MAG: P-loop containing nucleoside triphosphate hydrolase protein [Linnemannia elongata]|nr:MAG: P-loop containing nucleoside triphosphate hydrolase protein [Linnemannia elongata]